MANIKKVAELAGVGYGTVSRYINQSGYVSKESGEKIQAAIKELNYKPNELAKNLLRNQSKIIGVMVPIQDSLASLGAGFGSALADIIHLRIPAQPRGAYIRWGIDTRH